MFSVISKYSNNFANLFGSKTGFVHLVDGIINDLESSSSICHVKKHESELINIFCWQKIYINYFDVVPSQSNTSECEMKTFSSLRTSCMVHRICS